MTEDEFDRIADTFRDPRVWRRERAGWVKDGPMVSSVTVGEG